MQNSKLHNTLNLTVVLFWGLILFTLPLTPKFFPLLLLVVGVLSLKNYKQLNLYKKYWILLILPLFWMLHLLGGFFSDNMVYWKLDIEVKLSFILVPLIILLYPKQELKSLKWIWIAFVGGVLLASFLALIKAYNCLDFETERFCFESGNLAGGYHTTYMATFYLLGIGLVWYLFSYLKFKWYYIFIPIFISIYFLYFIYKLYALGPWVSLMLVVFVTPLFYFKQLKWWGVFSFYSIFLMIILFSVKKLELLESGYNAITIEYKEYVANPEMYIEKNKSNTKSINARVLLWSVSWGLVKDNPFGVGNGDTKDKLISTYRSLDMDVYADKKLNPHNQYLQTTIALGWIGFSVLLVMGLMGIYYSFKLKNYLLLVFTITFYSGMLFESILENQAGVIPFSIFYSFIFVSIIKIKSN